jgi:hypothetical protein
MPIPRMNLLKPISRKGWLLALVVLGLLGLTLFDWDEWGAGRRQEEKVALAQVPAPVKVTIEQEAKGGTLKDIEKTTIAGKTAYTASLSSTARNSGRASPKTAS